MSRSLLKTLVKKCSISEKCQEKLKHRDEAEFHITCDTPQVQHSKLALRKQDGNNKIEKTILSKTSNSEAKLRFTNTSEKTTKSSSIQSK